MFKLQDKLDQYIPELEKNNYKIRTMTLKDLNVAVEWAAKEGWNPGLHDAEPFYIADPNGYFVGEVDGKPVVFISAVKYDDKFGFMGFYIVDPDCRSQGYGLAIFKHAFEYMGNINIGGDGVLAQLENYKKVGFEIAYKNQRYEGLAKSMPANNTVDLKSVDFEMLNKYDYKMFLAQRTNFLKAWINMPDTYSLGFLDNKELKGYGVLRKCYKGYKIGPLFADSPEIAEFIFNDLTNKIPGELFYLDVPQPNSEAVKLALKNDMKVCFETCRIYTKEAPPLPIDNIFGVTTFELG